ncbi:MAG: hypothetical protein QM703_17050 [Gemmatales bacterium]
MPVLPNAIRSVSDAEMLVDWCLDTIGLGYHPDTVAADYIDDTGKQAFTIQEATELDWLHEKAFAAGFGDRMYSHGLNGMCAIMGLPPLGDS